MSMTKEQSLRTLGKITAEAHKIFRDYLDYKITPDEADALMGEIAARYAAVVIISEKEVGDAYLNFCLSRNVSYQ